MDVSTLDTREVPLVPDQAALLFIDAQNFSCRREGGEFENLSDGEFDERYGWFFDHITRETLPNMVKLQAQCRATGIEVIYTVIENLTLDGRDRSLDYRITGFNVPKGSWDAQVLSEIAPQGDEMVFPKTSSNVFISACSSSIPGRGPFKDNANPRSRPTPWSVRRSTIATACCVCWARAGWGASTKASIC